MVGEGHDTPRAQLPRLRLDELLDEHARARHTEVSIVAIDGVFTVTVTDDGVGVPEGGRRSGLRNLAERAAKLAGRLTVSARGATRHSTCLERTVPLPRADA